MLSCLEFFVIFLETVNGEFKLCLSIKTFFIKAYSNQKISDSDSFFSVDKVRDPTSSIGIVA